MSDRPKKRLEPDAKFFERIPTAPGVYLMKDTTGKVVYVGKAKNLRTRVKQYFRPGDDMRFFVAAGLLGRVLADIETVVVDNEKEALLLENNLIKRHQPRFNIKLRDDKQYLVLRIDPRSSYPRVDVVRNIKDDGARYFGPYHSATSCRETLRTVNRFFQLRTCSDHVLQTRKRVCLQYQIKRCPGPCVYPVPEDEYQEQVEDVMLFLAGKKAQLLPRLTARMRECSESEEFEAAAQIRDSIRAVEKSLAQQNVVQDSFVDQDVFGLWRDQDTVELVVLFIRAGKLVGRRSVRQRDQEFPDAQVLTSFVQQYYETGTFVPDEVIVPLELESTSLLTAWLTERRGKAVKIIAPKRGVRTRLIALANKNAAAAGVSRSDRDRDRRAGLEKLATRLGLKRPPHRMECFDIAHIQGTSAVASMVVFEDGEPAKRLYRKFNVKTATNDDFAAMYEVITRRFKRASEHKEGWEIPDLIIVDGGKGQLSSAVAALRDQKVDIVGEGGVDIIGLAKERELSERREPDRVYQPHRKDPVRLRANTAELYLLARIRDEAHRFANTFHQQKRGKKALRSALDDVPGIGAVRRKALLRTFGSVARLRLASIDELAAVPGMSRPAAEAVHAALAEES